MASVWMPGKACHDLIMILLCFSITRFLFIMYTDKDSNLISDRLLCFYVKNLLSQQNEMTNQLFSTTLTSMMTMRKMTAVLMMMT